MSSEDHETPQPVNSLKVPPTTTTTTPICLVLLMGLPASGKSTLAKKLVQEYSQKETGTFAISIAFDDFVSHDIQAKCTALSITKTESKTKSVTKSLRKKFINCVSYLVLLQQIRNETDLKLSPDCQDFLPNSHFEEKTKEILELIRKKKPCSLILLIDDNHYYSSMRSDFYHLAKTLRLGFCVLYCKTSVKTCRDRNSTREEKFRVPDKTIVEMSLKLEEPNPMANPEDAFCLQIGEDSTQDQNIPLITQVLENALKNPVEWTPPPDRSKEIEHERRICSQNEIHQADQILRKWINKELTMASFFKDKQPPTDKKVMWKELNRKRQIVLDKLRNGEFKVGAEVNQELKFRNDVIQLVMSVE